MSVDELIDDVLCCIKSEIYVNKFWNLLSLIGYNPSQTFTKKFKLNSSRYYKVDDDFRLPLKRAIFDVKYKLDMNNLEKQEILNKINFF